MRHQSFLKKKSWWPSRLGGMVIAILTLGVLLTVLNIYQLQQMREDRNNQVAVQPIMEGSLEPKQSPTAPIVWIHGKKLESGYLKHVSLVFDRLGYINGDGDSDWDVLWEHDYPFTTMAQYLKDLKPYQRVNHFPGSGYVTNKLSLTSTKIKALPLSFKIPDQREKFLTYARAHPEKLWVQKNNNHRGVRILKTEDVKLGSSESFVQEYVAKPFLIDGRKFDIGVYTVITSINPLRLYVLESDALFRFCSKNYYPFDKTDPNRYVVGDDYTPMWKMRSLRNTLIDKSYTYKQSFDAYMRHRVSSEKVNHIWQTIHQTIRSIYLEKEYLLKKAAAKFSTTRHFFELVRFDFSLDEKLKVYLMEVNMSPNLSTNHFAANRRLYEHVVFNTVKLAGLIRSTESGYLNSEGDEAEMQVSRKDVQVFVDWCISKECNKSCGLEKCKLCYYCVTDESRMKLKDAFLEHNNRGTFRRNFPPPISPDDALMWSPDNDFLNLSDYNSANKYMYMWFIGMCQKDKGWCY